MNNSPQNIVLVGGNGGIGLAMVKRILRVFPYACIHATYHHRCPPLHSPQLTWHQLDLSKPHQIDEFGRSFDHLDWLINCAGVLHTREQGPEKNVESINPHFFMHNIQLNTLPTLLLAQSFFNALRASPAPKLAVLSARVGSISDNHLGGWYSYRCSKAALNMAVKTLAIEWQRRLKQATVLALHPGTTDTQLSKPFQANVPTDKLFHVDEVATDLLALIIASTPNDSGSFWDYSGQTIPW
ncbi:SDR family oxidoreductase [Vibrio nitrifigilis]|uniref:SDR family oxidoreductase n=1 Tax=Vibrio nitrifigilis TaxID=2789781 RepID=A0ABS0GEK7_9VIBR|nr:SDR family oxidoreductase [Vibrio nitrifigilis]MBF9000849.1 SDR family oxidoreductase [Vibrio nitrifigilis]